MRIGQNQQMNKDVNVKQSKANSSVSSRAIRSQQTKNLIASSKQSKVVTRIGGPTNGGRKKRAHDAAAAAAAVANNASDNDEWSIEMVDEELEKRKQTFQSKLEKRKQSRKRKAATKTKAKGRSHTCTPRANRTPSVPVARTRTGRLEANNNFNDLEVEIDVVGLGVDTIDVDDDNVLWSTRELISQRLFEQITLSERLDGDKLLVKCKTCNTYLTILKGNNSNLKTHFKSVSLFEIIESNLNLFWNLIRITNIEIVFYRNIPNCTMK